MWEGLQVIPMVIKVRNLYGPYAILCYIEDICLFPPINKLITAKYWCRCVAQHSSSRTVPIKDATHPDRYTCVRVTWALLSIAFAYWHSRFNLFPVTNKQITILCRFTPSDIPRSPFSAHRRLALWCAFSITSGDAGSHSAACDAVLLFENCLRLQGQAVYWQWSEGNTVIPRLTKIIRSGITFVSRNVISRRFL